ncbi:ROK family transcriptional regulator [Planotetraspora kaengkrachanensis]|uniref:Transcriptional regulator n=1 Tax=Planotetraspora kaengkrachanensis TaxID=575193 RepID=A0A8J3PXS3_9ACTN|nr:ROK family protein [Planotetraspora kaengkrachanensis]GIG83064.1 transcriptional regulator [Planotetraspora kaengkrachanensis]
MSRRMSTPSAAQIRWINAAAIYEAMRARESCTAGDLMTATGLSRPTVHTTCDWLIAQNLVAEVVSDLVQDAQPGRPARRYRINPRAGFVLALDIRESRVTGAVADLTGGICSELCRDIAADPSLRSQAAVHGPSIAHELVELAGIDAGSVWQVCVSIPAPVQSREYAPSTAAQYRADTRDVITELEQTLPWPVVAENDANLAMIGEQWQGAAHHHDNAVLLDVCEHGFGAGLIVNGRLVRGSSGLAGEMTSVDLLSGMGPAGGVARKVAQLGAEAVRDASGTGPSPAQTGALFDLAHGDPEQVTDEMVFAALDVGDPAARRIADQVGAIVARPIAMLATLLDPELVVICGLSAEAADRLMPPIEEQTLELYRRLAAPPPRLALSALGGRATVIGGVRRALNEVEGRLFGSPHSDRWPATALRAADAQ